jgi:hypothetical protein
MRQEVRVLMSGQWYLLLVASTGVLLLDATSQERVQVAKPNCNRRKRKNLALPVIAEEKGDEKRVHFSEKVTIIEGTSLFILRTALVLIIHIRTTETCRLWCLNFFVWDTLAAEAPQLPINSDAGGVETGQYHAQGSAGSCD